MEGRFGSSRGSSGVWWCLGHVGEPWKVCDAGSLFKLVVTQLKPLNSLRMEDAVPTATSLPHCPGPQRAHCQ